jgi:hypothetical protein
MMEEGFNRLVYPRLGPHKFPGPGGKSEGLGFLISPDTSVLGHKIFFFGEAPSG